MVNLVQVYDKLLEFFQAANDDKKYFPTSEKSVNICHTKLQNFDKVVELLEARISFAKSVGKDDKVYQTNTELIRILGQNPNLNPEQSEKLKQSLLQVISDTSISIQNCEYLKTLIRLLYKTRDMEELLKVAFTMNGLFPEVAFALEWICKIYLEYVTETLHFKNETLENTIDTHFENLLSLNETSTLGRLAKAAWIWNVRKDLKEASKQLNDILEGATSPNFYALYIYCQCQLELRNFDQAENYLILAIAALPEKVKDEISRKKLEKILQSMLANACYAQGKFDKVIEALEHVDDHKDLIAKSYAHLGMETQVQGLLDQISVQDKYLSLAILAKQKGNLKESLNHLAEIKEDIFEAVLLKGKIHWESEEFDQAHKSFLMAAKSNPHSWMPFFYLGEFYKRPGPKQNLDQARKCYQKSFALNPQSSDAGPALSDILRIQGKYEENFNLLTSVSGKGHPWANLRLGMHYLAVDDPSKAILSLQNVLRTNPDHLNAWESLADAYFNR